MEDIFNKKLILNYLKENDLNEQTFCKLCNVPSDTVTKIINNDSNVKLLDIVRIVKFLKVPFFTMFIHKKRQ